MARGQTWRRQFVRVSFATRVAVATSMLIIATCIGQSAMQVHRDLEQVGGFLAAQGRSLSAGLARDAELAIVSGDRVGLRELARQLLSRADVVYCRILDQAGESLVNEGRLPAVPPAIGKAAIGPLAVDDLWEFQTPVHMLDTRPQREEIQLFDSEIAPVDHAPRGNRIGTVAVGISLAPLTEVRRQTIVAATLLTALVTLLAIASAFLIAKVITRPLKSLAAAADAIASGDMNVRVTTVTDDEIGAVAVSFNAMADSMAQSRAALQAYNLSLEEKVATRTQHLEALNHRLEEASQLKSGFLATVSHELRTPLNVILGYVEMLSDEVSGPLTAEQAELLNSIARYSKLQLALITNVLDFSRLSSGRISFHVERFALGTLLDEIRVLAGSRLTESVTLTAIAAPDVPDLETDRVKLQEIIRNLVDNALKFTDRGTVAITGSTDAGRGLIIIEVSDTGCGIAADDVANVFDPFRQVGDKHSRHTAGVGLGLSIVKQLVEALGGTVSVVSRLGAGTRFRIEIPPVLAVARTPVAQAS